MHSLPQVCFETSLSNSSAADVHAENNICFFRFSLCVAVVNPRSAGVRYYKHTFVTHVCHVCFGRLLGGEAFFLILVMDRPIGRGIVRVNCGAMLCQFVY